MVALTVHRDAPSVRREKGKTVKSRVRLIAGATLVVASVLAATAGVSLASGHDRTVYRADVMAGVTAPYTGANGTAIRDIHGGGAPWVIAESDIRLRESGRIDVEVEGLVIDPAFPNPAVAGINPVQSQEVIVSCLSTDANGAAVTINTPSNTFTVDRAGNGEARLMVNLPSPCFAPVVFVASAGGAWFAVSGA
jgi:hypothetical protein